MSWPAQVTHEDLDGLIDGYDSHQENYSRPHLRGATFHLVQHYPLNLAGSQSPEDMAGAMDHDSDEEYEDEVANNHGIQHGMRHNPHEVPPLVVHRNHEGDELLDGNHRSALGADAGATHHPAYLYTHHAKTAINQSRGDGPLPVDPGKTFYRLHYKPRAWNDNTSAETSELGHGMYKEDTRVPGKSALENPHDLHHYLDRMGWYDHAEYHGEHKHVVVQFPGTHRTDSSGRKLYGRDGEALVDPGPRRDRIEMPISEFKRRVEQTPEEGPGSFDHAAFGAHDELDRHLAEHHAGHVLNRLVDHNNVQMTPFDVHRMMHDQDWTGENKPNHTHDEMPKPHPWHSHYGPEGPHPDDQSGYAKTDRLRFHSAAWRPTQRIFGPTHGLDHRLFNEDGRLRSDVREYIMGTLGHFWDPIYGPEWRRWTNVYFAGSEASEWTSETLEGNNDFDVLVGVDYDAFRAQQGIEANNEEITAVMNGAFRDQLDPLTDQAMIMVDGKAEGPFENTWYVNPESYDIRAIRPYAAYNVSRDDWAVRPPHLESWSISSFPEGKALVRYCEGVSKALKAILAMPEPYRTQQAVAWWDHLHGDRSRAFTPQGEGWYDPANVVEKWLDQEGIWPQLWEAKHRAEQDSHALDAPADWSNDPGQKAARLLRSAP